MVQNFKMKGQADWRVPGLMSISFPHQSTSFLHGLHFTAPQIKKKDKPSKLEGYQMLSEDFLFW